MKLVLEPGRYLIGRQPLDNESVFSPGDFVGSNGNADTQCPREKLVNK